MTEASKMGYMCSCTLSKGYVLDVEHRHDSVGVLALDHTSDIQFNCTGDNQSEVINNIIEELIKIRDYIYLEDCANESE